MKKKLIFMYSGQGSQYYNMARELYENNHTFRSWMDRCSQFAEPQIGVSLTEILYQTRSNKFDPFDRTLYTHPIIFMVEYSLTKVFYDWGILPDILMGYSLGQFVAAAVSGAVSWEDAMTASIKQAQVLEQHSPKAGMMAVLDSPAVINQYTSEFAPCSMAGVNYEKHFVVTGKHSDLEHIQSVLKFDNILTFILPITHGFHSGLIEDSREEFLSSIENLSFSPPQIPTYSTSSLDWLKEVNSHFFYQVVRQEVRFKESVEFLESQGDYIYLDLGPAGTLSTFTKYLLKSDSGSSTLTSINQFGKDLDSLEKAKAIIHEQ